LEVKRETLDTILNLIELNLNALDSPEVPPFVCSINLLTVCSMVRILGLHLNALGRSPQLLAEVQAADSSSDLVQRIRSVLMRLASPIALPSAEPDVVAAAASVSKEALLVASSAFELLYSSPHERLRVLVSALEERIKDGGRASSLNVELVSEYFSSLSGSHFLARHFVELSSLLPAGRLDELRHLGEHLAAVCVLDAGDTFSTAQQTGQPVALPSVSVSLPSIELDDDVEEKKVVNVATNVRKKGTRVDRADVGARVQRGADWKWGQQDGGAGSIGLLDRVDKPGWAHVSWANGSGNAYRIGTEGKYDLVYAEDFTPPKPMRDEPVLVPEVGARVMRGPDWEWKDQDGGVGRLGTIIGADGDGWARVQWDTSHINRYRVGEESKYDLVYGETQDEEDASVPEFAAIGLRVPFPIERLPRTAGAPRVVRYKMGLRRDRMAVVLSDRPLRSVPGTKIVYFEVKVDLAGDRPAINVGVARGDYPLDDVDGANIRPGFAGLSQDGACFVDRLQREVFGRRWKTDDIVGCGVDLSDDTMFFTHNGVRLSKTKKLPKTHPWHAAVSFKNPGEAASINFGPDFTYHIPGYVKPQRSKGPLDSLSPVRVGTVSVRVLTMLLRQVVYRVVQHAKELPDADAAFYDALIPSELRQERAPASVQQVQSRAALS